MARAKAGKKCVLSGLEGGTEIFAPLCSIYYSPVVVDRVGTHPSRPWNIHRVSALIEAGGGGGGNNIDTEERRERGNAVISIATETRIDLCFVRRGKQGT